MTRPRRYDRVNDMTATVRIDDGEFLPALLTGEDVLAMTRAGVVPEGRGYELIEGVLVAMAAQYDPHVKRIAILLRRLNAMLAEDHLVGSAPSIFLSEHTMLEPDIAIYPMAMKSTDVRGPDLALVIEVSDTTLRNDLGKKARLYAAHGVRHYWVVDVTGERLHRHTEPGEAGYGRIAVSGPGEAVPLPMPLASNGAELHIFG